MIDANSFILYVIVVYCIVGIMYILLGASNTSKTYATHYGFIDVMVGLVLLLVGIAMYVI